MQQRLRIFISSPTDVPDERLRADLIIDKLSQDYGRFFVIKAYRWEHEAMLASKHFQDAIEPPSAFDIVVLILWSRLGTSLPEKTAEREYRGIDGRAPVTGTEWEFEEALKVAREKNAPDLLAFRNVSPAPIDPRDPDAQAKSIAQLGALNAFWTRHFVDRGVFLAAFDEYRTLEEFARRVEGSLRKLIERRIKDSSSGLSQTGPIWLGEPFRGLESYEFEHAPIFFGRDAAITKATEQLAANARSGCAFLLVSGASGSGKSSMIKAGVVPRLMKPQRISGLAFLRRSLFRPGNEGTDVFLGLAEALTRRDGQDVGLPELIAPGQDAIQLAVHLRRATHEPGYLFANALGRLTEAERRSGRLLPFEDAKLILIVDQLEELFTFPGISADDRRLFIQLLAGLARSGAVWVIATLRADFWHHSAEIPELMELAEGRGRMDLAAASPAELAEMIRKPALVAGLSFEAHPETGLALDAVLAEDAAAAPGALPLLSFTLDELYKKAKARGTAVLTHESYEALGGLEGAIAHRADETLAHLPAAAQGALPRVLRALTTVSGPSDQVPVARSASLTSFSEESPARVLVDAFTAARLLVAASEGGAPPTVRLAHEALISRWQRARDRIAADRRDLETRAHIELQFDRWREARGPARRLLLLRNPDLANATDLVMRWGDEFDVPMRDYVRRSARRARIVQTLTAAVAMLFALVAAGAFYAERQAVRAGDRARVATQEAEAQRARADEAAKQATADRDRATAQEAKAKEARDRAIATQSKLLAERASRLTEQGDTLTAILLSLEAFRGPEWNSPDRYEITAEKSLADAVYENPLLSIVSHPTVKYVDAAFTSAGAGLVAVGNDGSATFWPLGADGSIAGKPEVNTTLGRITRVVANPKLPILAFFREDNSYFAWNYQNRQPVAGVQGSCPKSDSDSSKFEFDRDGGRLIIFCNTLSIFNLATGRVLRKVGPYNDFALAGNGSRIVAKREASKLIEVWNVQTGDLVKSWTSPNTIQGLSISFDGETVLTTTYAGVSFWKSTTGKAQKPMLKPSQGRTFEIYTSPNNDLFLTQGDDGQKVWSRSRDATVQQFGVGTYSDPTFLPNGMLALRDSDKGDIILWAYVIEGHMGTYEAVQRAVMHVTGGHTIAASSPDGKGVVTTTASGKLYLWRTDPAMLLHADNTIEGTLNALELSRTGNTIAAGNGKVAMLWDANTLAQTKRIDAKSEIRSIKLSHDASRVMLLVAATNHEEVDYKLNEADNGPKRIDVFDVASGKHIFPVTGGKPATSADMSADGQFIVGVTDDAVVRWRIADGQSARCAIPNAIFVLFGATPNQVYFSVSDMVVRRLEFESCAAKDVLSFSSHDRAGIVLMYRNALLIARQSWRDDEGSLVSRMKIWSESQSTQILDSTETYWDHIDVTATAGRILLAEVTDKTLHVFDAAGGELLTFDLDWNDCCENVGIRLYPGASKFVTAWQERGMSRLRTWRFFPSVDALKDYAREAVPECLSPARRTELGLEVDPPAWCIEMGKPPYDTEDWKEWLSYRSDNLAAPLPGTPEWQQWLSSRKPVR